MYNVNSWWMMTGILVSCILYISSLGLSKLMNNDRISIFQLLLLGMSFSSVAESSVSSMVLVIDIHVCLRIRSWTDLASYPAWLGLLCWSCHFQAVWSNIIDSLTSLLFIFSNRLVLIFQNLITYLDELIIIQVGFQSLNTNAKNIERENHFNLIFFLNPITCVYNSSRLTKFSQPVLILITCVVPKKIQKQTYPAANIEKKRQPANTGFYSPFGCWLWPIRMGDVGVNSTWHVL